MTRSPSGFGGDSVHLDEDNNSLCSGQNYMGNLRVQELMITIALKKCFLINYIDNLSLQLNFVAWSILNKSLFSHKAVVMWDSSYIVYKTLFILLEQHPSNFESCNIYPTIYV